MSMPRRRVIRPETTLIDQPRQRQLEKLRLRLASERIALSRWVSRLRRSFHAMEKRQLQVARLERRITQLEA